MWSTPALDALVSPPAPLAPPSALHLGGGNDPLVEKLFAQLLPRIQHLVDEAVQVAVAKATADMHFGSTPGVVALGPLAPGKAGTVDWTFTNSGREFWPAGARLRFLGGRLVPPADFVPAPSVAPTAPGAPLTVRATMTVPRDLGPCEGQWQLEGQDGSMLLTPLLAKGRVVAPAGEVIASPERPPNSSKPATPLVLPSSNLFDKISVELRPPASIPQANASQLSLSSVAACSGATAWHEAFEDFFGTENATRLRQSGDIEREVHRMINKVWEYMKQNGLQMTGSESVQLDVRMQQLFAPLLPEGTTTLAGPRDLLPMTRQVALRYLQSA